ncbi:hypothetical protein RUM43_007628 [Polyplax serrata]|uniref:Homeobox domain-containing protein n=1 Tax=Polyplax serrata TaxID=468196 RepID=A0AAN8P5Z7_POLSC
MCLFNVCLVSLVPDGIGIMKPTKRKKDLLEKQHQHLHLSQSVNLSLMSPHHQDLGGGSLSDGGHSSDNTDCEKKKKKARTTFTGRQIFELEKQFENKKYLSSSERSEMAKLLQVTETQVSGQLICKEKRTRYRGGGSHPLQSPGVCISNRYAVLISELSVISIVKSEAQLIKLSL